MSSTSQEEKSMTGSRCSGPDCDRAVRAKGLCPGHYYQSRASGTLTRILRDATRASLAERVADRIGDRNANGCRIWQGHVSPVHGYGVIRIDKQPVSAHRTVWREFRGEIPEGMQVDHVCGVRACVSIEHLRLVTQQENLAYKTRLHPNNTSGVPGVSRVGQSSRWEAYAWAGGRKIRLGTFADLSSAAQASLEYREKHYPLGVHPSLKEAYNAHIDY